MQIRIGLIGACLALALGCDDGASGTAAADAATLDAATLDGGPQPDAAETLDAAPDAAVDAAPDAAPPPTCDGVPGARVAFADGAGGFQFGDLAADFTANTLDRPLTLSQHWTGCDSYVFLVYFPDLRQTPQGPWIGDALWDSDPLPLLTLGAPNTHYVFLSFEPDAETRRARMEAMRSRIALGISVRPAEMTAGWAERLHFVTDRLTEVEGSLGAFAGDYLDFMFSPEGLVDLGDRGMAQAPLPFTFAIDRFQRWDAGGSLSPVVGQPQTWAMAAYFGPFYNHMAAVRARVAAEPATEVVLLDERVSDRVFVRTVTLPDAAAMAEVDTLDLDVGVFCPARNPFGCSEWDRIADVELCLDGPDCADRREIARWITPYWRRGERRWLIDASPFLALLRAGGETTFRVEMGPEWERKTERDARIALRLRTAGDAPRAQGAERAFTGGSFGADYNTREPFTFAPPADADRVELVLILSGHGQTDGDNCAEWCDHRHAFTVNGADIPVVRSPQAPGTLRGCADRAGEGVPPGQWGNWAPGRAYWCPGLPVDAIRIDVTEHVQPGMENTVTYRGQFGAREPAGGDIALSAYVVWYGQ
ncbi:MAG: hypothetical protein H6704_30200 [Myxococcales bacterium]|nr:hypothetical protein [Myxococcales bacterium]